MPSNNTNHFDIINRIDLDTTPHRAAAHWNADTTSLELINQGINVVYRFSAEGQSYFLKITHAQLKSSDALAASWDFLHHLAGNSAPVSAPMLSSDGQKVVAIPQGEDTFLSTVTYAMPGELLPETMLPKETFIVWGRTLAQMHLAAASFQPKDRSLYLNWKHVWAETRALIEPDDQAALAEFGLVDAWLQTLSEDTPDFGLAHADFRAGNAILQQGRVSIIDFDEPVWHWFAADIARPFLELLDYPLQDRRKALDWFTKGYRSECPLDESWDEHLSWFMRMKMLDIYAWSATNWDPRQPLTRKRWIDHYQHRLTHPLEW